MKSCKQLSVAVLFSLIITSQATAQFSLRGSINGVVTDESGAVVQDADVTLTDTERNQTYKTKTNSEGLYAFANLTFGRYQVTVERPGFSKAVSGAITLASQEAQRMDIRLRAGEVTETVSVTSEASTIQHEQGLVGQVINRKFIDTLPIKGRNYTGLSVLSPNVTTFGGGNSPGTFSVGSHHVFSNVTYVVGGGGNNGYYMNGVNTNDNWVGAQSYTPSTEAVVEAKLDVANFSAENGRDISTFSISTRGGTSAFHGSVYDYFQNSSLNAVDPYDKAIGNPGEKDWYTRNQYGGNLGGPILIPKLFNRRDKLFFFVNYEGMRQRERGNNDPVRVPTEAERGGDFSDLLRRFPGDPNFVLYNPFSTVINDDGESIRTPIPNNDLRLAARPDGSPLIDPRAQELLGLYPLPNYVSPFPGDLANYRAFTTNGLRNYRIDTRFDYNISNKNSVYVNISRSHGIDDRKGGVFPELLGNNEDSSYLVTVNYSHIFSPRMTNEFIFAKGKGTMFSVDQNTIDYMNRTDTLRNKFFQNLGTGEDTGVYVMNVNDYPSPGFPEVFMASNPTLQFSDNLTWLKGRHSFKMGFNYFLKKEVDWDFLRSVSFSGQYTRAGSAPDLDEDRSLGGNAIADLLIGLPASLGQRFDFGTGDAHDPYLNFAIPYYGAFFEDKIQVNQNLTVSLGLRYDLSIPTYSPSRYGGATFDFDYPGWQLAIPGRAPDVPLHLVRADKNNFAPRISVAYRPKSDLVLRLSYGIFYDQGVFNTSSGILDGAFFGSVPGYTTDNYDHNRLGIHEDLAGYTFNDIFPTQQKVEIGTYPISTGSGMGYYDFLASINFSDRDSGTSPYYQRYLFEVQKQVFGKTVLSLTYNGSRGIKLPYYENLNLPPYRLGWANDDEFNGARPNNIGRWADVRVLRHGLNSSYNAATIKAERRFSNGLQFLAHYTFSKTVTDRGDWQWNRRLGRGEAGFSHPHRFVSAVTYETPWGRTLPGLFKTLLWGWRVSTITIFESGDALTVFNNQSSARDFEPDMPDLVGDPNLPRGQRTFLRYFNTSAFADPGDDRKGAAGPGIVRGPGINNWDISLAKVFRLSERWSLEFRGDMYNAFNHAQWDEIDTGFSTAGDNQFGRITGAREPRVAQLSLKITF
jgi:Carboxypeptidase regulatory-like domain/TonB dependent receptor